MLYDIIYSTFPSLMKCVRCFFLKEKTRESKFPEDCRLSQAKKREKASPK